MKKVLIYGPCLNDFDYEIKSTRPFYEWLKFKFIDSKVYICSKNYRDFLYDKNFFIDFDNLNFNNVLNTKNKFSKAIKDMKVKIAIKEDINQKDIEILTLPYNKNIQILENFKIYTKIKERSIINNNKIICILKEEDLDCYKTFFNNKIFEIIIEKENNEKSIFDILCKSYFCLTNLSHWAFISNLHNIPNFYWGNDYKRFKNNELWNFNNKYSHSIYLENENENYFKILKNHIDFILKGTF